MKNQKGITLVALVVTIVVLLILAGITIMYVLSDDGIFSSAKQSRVESEMGSLRDYLSQAQATYMMEYYKLETTSTTPTTEILEATRNTLAQKCVTDNVPSDPFKPKTVTSITGDTSGRIGGTAEITGKYGTYTVTYSNGVATVAQKPTTK